MSDALLGGVGVVSVGVTGATVGGGLTVALVQLVRSRMMVCRGTIFSCSNKGWERKA